MALSHLEKFVTEYSNDTAGLKAKYKKDPDGTLKSYGLTGAEAALVKRGDANEIKSHMKDAYGAALLINMP